MDLAKSMLMLPEISGTQIGPLQRYQHFCLATYAALFCAHYVRQFATRCYDISFSSLTWATIEPCTSQVKLVGSTAKRTPSLSLFNSFSPKTSDSSLYPDILQDAFA